jgi:predicted transcriptional regulator
MVRASSSFQVDPSLRDRLKMEAKLAKQSVSELAEVAISDFLDLRSRARAAAEAALSEAREDVFISADAMDRWVASWGSSDELAPPEPDVFDGRGSSRAEPAPNRSAST